MPLSPPPEGGRESWNSSLRGSLHVQSRFCPEKQEEGALALEEHLGGLVSSAPPSCRLLVSLTSGCRLLKEG